MSLLADNLFALLLGWTRSLFNNLWNLITNNSSGFWGFLQRFWLPLLIILLLAGSFFDLIIWLIRWRPYYVWGSHLRKRANRRRLERTADYMENLDYSPLDLPEYRHFAHEQCHELPDEPVYFDYMQPDAQEPYFQPVQEPHEKGTVYSGMPQFEPETHFMPNLPWQPVVQDIPPAYEDVNDVAFSCSETDPFVQESQHASDAVYMPPVMMNHPSLNNKETLPRHNEEPSPKTSTRRRRTETRRQRNNVLQSIKDTFFTAEDEQKSIDSFHPQIKQEDAFHEPYYPQNYSYKDQSVRIPPEDQNNQ